MRRLLSSIFIAATLGIVPSAVQEPVDRAMLARIKDEGLQRSRAQETLLRSHGWDRSSPDRLSLARAGGALGAELGLRSSDSPMRGWSRSHFRVAGHWKKSR